MHRCLVISGNSYIIISEVCMTKVLTKADALEVFSRKGNGSPVNPELVEEYRRALESDKSNDPLIWAALFVQVWAKLARRPAAQPRLSS